MTTYNTGNPIGSANVKDLYDNAENLDTAVNGTEQTWTDRLGRERLTWDGATALQSTGQVNVYFADTQSVAEAMAASLPDGATIIYPDDDGITTRSTVASGVLTDLVADTAAGVQSEGGASVQQVLNRNGLGLRLPAALSGSKWRRKRAKVLAGISRAHIVILGDSQAFGAASTGNTSPKYVSCWPGRLAAMLSRQGMYGGGWQFANADVFNNPAWDSRWAFDSGVTSPVGTGATGSFGWHRASTFLIPNGNYIEFTDEFDSFQVWTGTGAAGLYEVFVDGLPVGTVGNGSGIGTIAKLSGYAPGQSLTEIIDAGGFGEHTVRITAPASSATYFLGIKKIISGDGKIEISNPSINGKSLLSLWAASSSHNDEVNGLYGLPLIDGVKGDLYVNALGINDWQFNSPPQTLSDTQARLATLVARQTTSGSAPTGAAKADGDAMLLWYPEPLNSLGASPQTWEEWRAGWNAAAAALGVPLIDLGYRFGGYAAGVAAGLMADAIHRNDEGSLDEVAAIYEAIMHRI